MSGNSCYHYTIDDSISTSTASWRTVANIKFQKQCHKKVYVCVEVPKYCRHNIALAMCTSGKLLVMLDTSMEYSREGVSIIDCSDHYKIGMFLGVSEASAKLDVYVRTTEQDVKVEISKAYLEVSDAV